MVGIYGKGGWADHSNVPFRSKGYRNRMSHRWLFDPMKNKALWRTEQQKYALYEIKHWLRRMLNPVYKTRRNVGTAMLHLKRISDERAFEIQMMKAAERAERGGPLMTRARLPRKLGFIGPKYYAPKYAPGFNPPRLCN